VPVAISGARGRKIQFYQRGREKVGEKRASLAYTINVVPDVYSCDLQVRSGTLHSFELAIRKKLIRS
jgi:hypothetical protein